MSNESTKQKTPALALATCYALRDTRITQAGVMRCCLGTVAEEYEGKAGAEDSRVTLGMKSKCRHCGQAFTLSAGKKYPTWLPDWQLQHNVKDEPRAKRVGSGPWLGVSGASPTRDAEPTPPANDHP